MAVLVYRHTAEERHWRLTHPWRVAVLCLLSLAVMGSPLMGIGAANAEKHAKPSAKYKSLVEDGYQMWLSQLRADAVASGVTNETFNAAMRDVTPDWSLPDLILPNLGPDAPAPPVSKKQDKQQAEFGRPSSYIPERSMARIAKLGRRELKSWGKTLEAIEKEYGVQKSVILAIWGRETGFGRAKIPHYTIRALTTQAFLGRRKEFFRKELLLGLQILQAGHISREKMRSSWAGAMGHTQFLPSDFHKYAIDYDRDGRLDIWGTIPDALASTANFLNKNGWEAGKTWGYEVRLPRKFDCTLAGPDNARPIRDWLALGLKRTYDREFKDDRQGEKAFLVLPAGTMGPAFLAINNFAVIKRYNKADLYALYVGHLADRIYSDSKFEGRWSKVSGFGRSDVKLLQQRIADSGIDVGKIDGLIGSKTRAAVGSFQKKLGLKPTCYPSRALINRIKSASN
jgi:lytic murein transglycosylase